MKDLKAQVEGYLEREPKFRERRNKDKGLVNLLILMYPQLSILVLDGKMSKDSLVAMVQDYNSMDRAWRQALEHNPELRGSDYADKVRLEAKVVEQLGYTTREKIS